MAARDARSDDVRLALDDGTGRAGPEVMEHAEPRRVTRPGEILRDTGRIRLTWNEAHATMSTMEVQHHPGTPAPRHPGTPAPRHPGTPAPRHPGMPCSLRRR